MVLLDKSDTSESLSGKWLDCLPLPTEVAAVPSGYVAPVYATNPDEWLYKDGAGGQYKRSEYVKKWGIDPYRVLERMGRIGRSAPFRIGRY